MTVLHSPYLIKYIKYISDKAGLRQYLIEGYKDKLYITLQPDWEALHVSEIYTPSILVNDQRKKEQGDEKFKSLGSYREIFYNDDILQKRAVLIGEAGCGKSTFCKHITEIWRGSTSAPASQFTDTDVLKQINYLFYVSCRFAKKEDTILNMIADQLFSGDSKLSVARYVLKHHPDLCLIIVDGADEWEGTSASRRRDDIVGLPGLEGVEDCVILITSRPWKFHSLSTHEREKFWRLKIDGIQNVKKLSQQILLKLEDPTPEKSADEFLRQVTNRGMSDLMKIPFILIIAIRGWVGDNDDKMVRSLHKSLCINYINMIQSFIRRSEGQAEWSISKSKLRQLVPNFENLQIKWEKTSNELPPVFSQYEEYEDIQRYAGLLLSVGHLALDLLLGTEEQSLVFSKAKVKKYLRGGDENDDSIKACLVLGIISKAETIPHGLKKLESYSFCHKTFQEFFAALWLASKYQTEKNKLHQCIKSVKDLLGFEMLIKFLCGFDPAIGKQMWLDVLEEVEMEQWEQVQVKNLACRLMKELEVDLKDQKSSQVFFCNALNMSSLQARLNDSEYKNWVKAGLCLMYTKNGLEDFVDNTTKQLHQNVIGSLTRQLGAQTGQAVCGVTIRRQQLEITCKHPYCQAFLNAVKHEGLDPTQPFTIRHGNIGNSNTSLWHSHPYELSKLFMNGGQQPTQSGPAETDLSGLVNFIAHCRVPSSQITSRRFLDEVSTFNRVFYLCRYIITLCMFCMFFEEKKAKKLWEYCL